MSLKIWLPLNGDLTNNGTSNVTVINSGATVNNNGKIGKCYVFTSGSSNYITASPAPFSDSTTEWSFACWFKPTTSHQGCLFSNRISTSTTGITIFYANGSIYVDFGERWSFTPSVAITVGVWNHIAFSIKRNSVSSCYINGQLVGTYTFTTATTIASATQCSFGASQGATSTPNGNYLNGSLNDVRLYDHALSPSEVHELALGLVCHYKLDRIGQNDNNLITGLTAGGRTTVTNNNTVTTEGTNSDTYFTINLSENIVVGQRYTLSCNASNVASGYKWRFPLGTQGNTSLPFFIDNGYNEYTFVANDISWGNNRIFMDDSNTSNNVRLTQAVFTDFRLYKADTIIDSSGFEYNLLPQGTLEYSSDSGRYDGCLVFDGSTSHINNTTMSLPLTGDPTFTYSAWIKWGDDSWPSNYPCVVRYGNLSQYNVAALCIYQGKLDLDFWNYRYIQTTATMTVGTWHHVAATKTSGAINTTCKLYVDGVEVAGSGNSSSSINITDSSSKLVIGVLNSATGRWFNGSISDVRIYATALSADDVKKLYNLGMKIDNDAVAHGFDFHEEDSAQINKNGIVKTTNLIEQNGLEFLKYDSSIYVEPDGSCWIKIFHHNNPTGVKFSASSTYANSVYIDVDRWFNVEVCSHVNKWEFIIAQQPNNTDAVSKFRFSQTKNPMTCTFSDVDAADIIKITSDGYATSSSSYGGIYYKNTNTYLACNNASSTSWWGAIGCWTAYNSGIPGYNEIVVKSGYIDLYLRIDNIDFSSPTIARILNSKAMLSREFIEI